MFATLSPRILAALIVVLGLVLVSARANIARAEPETPDPFAPVVTLLDLSPLGTVANAPIDGSSSFELVIGSDTRGPILDTTQPVARTVTHLYLFDSAHRPIGFCSGTMIADDVVLTAAHCVHTLDGGPQVSAIGVAPGDTPTSFPFGTGVAKAVSYPQGWATTGARRFDFALIHLDGKPFGSRIGPYLTLAAVPDAYFDDPALQLATFGYPGDKTFASMWGSEATDWYVDSDFIYMNTDTVAGQSGSSIMSLNESRREGFIVGIHSGSEQAGNLARNIAVRLSVRVLQSLTDYCTAASCSFSAVSLGASAPAATPVITPTVTATATAPRPTPTMTSVATVAPTTVPIVQTTTVPSTAGRIVSGQIPQGGGFGLFVFGGGSNEQLLAASGCPLSRAAFWATSASGEFVTYVPGSTVAVVNAAWQSMFASGIPASTPLLARC